MTYAPARLLAVRAYLKPLVGLSDNELGIVGDSAHVGGYHHGWEQRRTVNGETADYSWLESVRDSSHKTGASRAFDLGWFDRVINGVRRNLIDFNLWLAGQCEKHRDDPGHWSADIREVIYTPDGKTVKRWDRLRKRTSGDSSHLRHTHISWFADAETRDKLALFREFFEGNPDIPTAPGEDDMFTQYHEATLNGISERTAQTLNELRAAAAAGETRDAAMLTAIKALASGGSVEAAPIIEAIAVEGERTRKLVAERHQAELEALQRQTDAQIAGLRAELERLQAA